MSVGHYHPKRRLRSELLPLAVVLALPVALVLAFPDGAVGFVPAEPAKAVTTVNACVELSPGREAELLKLARASWQSDSSSRRVLRANLLACEFSEGSARIASELVPSPPERIAGMAECELDAIPRGVGASAPAVLPADRQEAPPPAFSKAELLKLN